MPKRLLPFLIVVFFVINNKLVFGQNFNPYQNAYQGWDGDKIKKASPVRAFLNKFSVNASIGYGQTFYNFKVDNDLLETPENLILLDNYTLSNDSINYTGNINWFNAPTSVAGSSYLAGDSLYHILNADSSEINYGGSGFNIPFRLSVQYDIDRFRVGGGISYEIHDVKSFEPRGQGIYPYVPNFNSTTMFRYFLTVGGKVYSIMGWDYYVDIEFGKVNYGKQYDKNALENGLYFSLGIPIEYEFSEYFWFFVRPSFEYKNYSIVVPQEDLSTSLQFNQPALYVNFGVRIKLPEIKRCPVKSCSTQLKHVHGGQEFRGQPFFKEQNPKIGELYPKLEMYKRKNRDKSKGKKYGHEGPK